MRADWEMLPLSEAPLEIIDGDRGTNYPKQGDFGASGDCLFLNTGNVTTTGFNFSDCDFITREKDATLRKGKLRRRDVVLTTRGTVGNVAYFDNSIPFENIRINSGMVLLRADESRLWPPFLYHFVRSPNFIGQVVALSTGSAQPQLPIRDIRRVKIPLPPLAEQKAIVSVLGPLDDKIELNRRMNATLEAMARALFQSWFVDFGPVRAKLDGHQPTGLDPATAALFPNEFEDSELGPIPKGWRVMSLPDAIEVNPRRKLVPGTTAPYLEMKNMPTQGHCPDKVIPREFTSGTKFQQGDTLVARITPCLENGKTAFVDFLDNGEIGWGSTEYIVFSTKPPLPPQFGYLVARSDPFRAHAIQNMTGTSGRQRVPPECFGSYLFAVPPREIAERFGEVVAPTFARVKSNVAESRTLASIRDALLPKLLSGELSVPKTDLENA
jgi:type I restriction enzyme S subunit